jgi:hypothetical protein
MADKPQLNRILQLVAQKMRTDFEITQASVQHRGSAGTVRERILDNFLKDYLPRTVDVVGSGEILAADGSRSKQCDVLIVDPSTPPLYVGHSDSHRVVPSECAYGVVEVKSNVTASELIQACENIKSAKERPKLALGDDLFGRTTHRYGRQWMYTPTVGLIFGFGGASLKTLGQTFSEWCRDVPHHLRPDSIWILGKGMLSWAEPDEPNSLSAYSEPGGLLRALEPCDEQDILLPLVFRLNHHFRHVFMPHFDIEKYAGGSGLAVFTENVWNTTGAE